MRKYWFIIKDALILVVVSTVFVTVVNQAFKGLKKTAGGDPLVTAVNQDDDKAVKEVLSETEFKRDPKGAASFDEYLKARVSYVDDQKRTSLMWAAYVNMKDQKSVAESDVRRATMVEIIAKAGADLNARDEHLWTPLMWAAWSGVPKTAAKFIELGADVALTDARGNTALILAAQRGNVAIVQSLLEKGSNPTAANTSGKTAKDLAREGLFQYPAKEKAYQKILMLLGS